MSRPATSIQDPAIEQAIAIQLGHRAPFSPKELHGLQRLVVRNAELLDEPRWLPDTQAIAVFGSYAELLGSIVSLRLPDGTIIDAAG